MKHKDKHLNAATPEQKGDLLEFLLRMAGPRPPVPEEVRIRVHNVVQSEWKNVVRQRTQRHILISFSSMVLVSLLLIFVGWQFLVQEKVSNTPLAIVENFTGVVTLERAEKTEARDPLFEKQILLPGSTLETGSSGKVLLHLMGGTKLRLDTSSRLTLSSQNSFVLDQGKVYLDCKQSSASVNVITKFGLVRDIGTRFEVKLQPDDLRIRVRDGMVEVKQGSVSQTVSEGRQLLTNGKGKAVFSDVNKYGAEWDWISEIAPRYQLEGSTLMEFLTWVTKENGWELKFSEPGIQTAAPGIILHGSVKGIRPNQMPEVVLPICGLRYDLNQGIMMVGTIRK